MKSPLFALLIGCPAIFTGAPLFAQNQYSFQNPALAVEDRVNNAVSLMTLTEKINFLHFHVGVPRLGIPPLGSAEGLHGEAMGGVANWAPRPPIPTTTFPQSFGLGETWDPSLLQQAASAEGYEARYIAQNKKYHQDALVIFSPNADLGRDPRWGRTEECYGEDPFFNGTMVVAFVRGLQGDNPRYWQTASLLKHFLANSNENGRDDSSSDFDERLFREYYSVPFRMGIVDGGARALMASYNSVNGIPMIVNPVLKSVTVDEWGENGIITTDGGAFKLLMTAHHFTTNSAVAAAAAIKAGITVFLDHAQTNLVTAISNALAENLLSVTDIDNSVKGNLRVMIKLGLLDPPDNNPYAKIGRGSEPEPWLSPEHRALARRVTQESIVLLKNSDGLLPLDKAKIKSIAVIGPRANVVLPDWYGGQPPYTVSPLDGIKNKVGPDVTVNFATNDDHGEAVKLARSSDVVIVCVGNHPTGDVTNWAKVALPSYGREAVDRQSITLEDERLIKKVYAANHHTVVVLVSSFPYAINWTQKHVPAIIHLTHSSQELGNALADVLFGDYNPAGRLVETWPKSLRQLPPMMDYNLRDGRTYMYFKGQPLYPFGYGLSYSTFEYSNLKTSSPTLSLDGTLTVSVDVKNTGARAGDEVVQLYVKHLNSTVSRPMKELKGFKRVTLQPGELKQIDILLPAKLLAYWNSDKHDFEVEPDKIQIMVGGSSADLRLQTIIDVNNGLMISQTRTFDPGLDTMRLHTKGNKVLDATGKPVRLCGVNIASLEWTNDGDHIAESVNRAIDDWKVNFVRLPLAQDRWFGKMPNQSDGGTAYRAIVDNLVDTCAAAHVYIDLDLHWSDCGKWVGEGGSLGQHNMPDQHSVEFWQDLATRYKNQPNVIFGLYNEPHDVSFEVWRNGGTVTDKPARQDPNQAAVVYQTPGLQALYNTVRATGARNLLTVGGLDWAYDLSGVLRGYAITGTNLIYETHPYPFKKKDWDSEFGAASEKFPVLMGEWGFGDRGKYGTNIMNHLKYAQHLIDYANQHDLHWTAWDLHPAAGPTLIKNWQYEPTIFGQFVQDQLATAALARSPNH
ncbi:MAG TPA: glycoside hydrolase family 3 C-terminal domain-containing protein [Verrucomicrobiae bacterium]